MQHLEHHLAMIREREARLRSIRVPARAAPVPPRPIRAQLGESIIRLGRRVAGERLITPVGTG